MKNFDPNNTKINEKSYKNCFIGYVTVKDAKYVNINRENPLYLIFSKVNGYIEQINKNKYLTLAPNNETKEMIKKMKNCGIKSEI